MRYRAEDRTPGTRLAFTLVIKEPYRNMYAGHRLPAVGFTYECFKIQRVPHIPFSPILNKVK